MKVIIAGSRGIQTPEIVHAAIEHSGLADSITQVVSGGAIGVDRIGEAWGKSHGIEVIQFLPKWSLLGRRAGRKRNEEMAVYADALIAVWDGHSQGTKHMIDTMKRLGKPVFSSEGADKL